MSVYIIASLIAAIGVLSTLLAVKISKLKRTQDKLNSKTVELSIKQQELEVVRDLQEKLNNTKQKKSPEKVEAPASGDSASRLNRLNGMSDDSKD